MTQILGRTLLPGQESPQQTTGQSVTSKLEPVRDLGLFAQEEVLLADRKLLLTAGVRADRSSQNGNTGKYSFTPSSRRPIGLPTHSAGWTPSSFAAPTGRPATGRHASMPRTSPTPRGPSAGCSGPTSVARRGTQPSSPSGSRSSRAASTPRSRWQGRADAHGISAGYSQSYPGTDHRSFHGPGVPRPSASDGRLRNRGLEASLTVQPIQGKNVNWVSRATFFANRAKITRLDGAGVPDRRFCPLPGNLPTGGRQLSDPALRSGRNRCHRGCHRRQSRRRKPDFQMSFSNDIDFHRFTLGFLFDWKHGGDIINLTEFLYDTAANSKDFVSADSAGFKRINTFGAGLHPALRPGRIYLKLREVNLSYNLPESFTRIFGPSVRYARLSVTGRNLLRVTPYRRAGSGGQQLRQPSDRAEHRRGSVPAEPQFLLLRRPGVLTMTPTQADTSSAGPVGHRRGRLQLRHSEPQQPRRDR